MKASGFWWLVCSAFGATALLSALAGDAQAAPSAPEPALSTPAPLASESAALSDSELTAMFTRATDSGVSDDARKEAQKSVEMLGPSAVPALTGKLGLLRKSSAATTHAALREVKERVGGDPTEWPSALMKGKNASDPAAKNAVCILLTLRALARSGTTAGARAILASSEDGAGLLRPEVTRDLKLMGENAIPALLEARRSPVETRRFAQGLLEALGKKTAGDAAQVTSREVLCDVLKAWGSTKDPEAISVVLTFVNSDRAQVRQAARDALAEYGQEAIWKLRESYTNLTGKAPNESWNAETTAKELFAAFDKVRLADVYALLDAGLALVKDQKFAEASEHFDKVLAREPLLDRRREMVAGYTQFAESQQDLDRPKALAIYRKTLRLLPDAERRDQIDSAVLTLEARDLTDQGIYDSALLTTALTKDPSNARARADLDGYDVHTEVKKEHTKRYAAGAGVLLAAFVGIFVFGRRKRG